LEASGNKGKPPAINVHVEPAPPADRLDVVYTRKYAIDSELWNQRAKALIVDWIPHCIAMCERTDIAPGRGDGGLDNFIEAGKANRGEPHGKHKGYVFSNAWVHQTVESMCIALMVDPRGDAEIEQAHKLMRATLERWIPIILGAQMPDGYLQTAYTLANRKDWPERWSPDEPDCSSRSRSSNVCLHPGTGRPDFPRTIDPDTYYTNASLVVFPKPCMAPPVR